VGDSIPAAEDSLGGFDTRSGGPQSETHPIGVQEGKVVEGPSSPESKLDSNHLETAVSPAASNGTEQGIPIQVPERSERYLRFLLWVLMPAALFASYDAELRAVLLKNIQASFHVSVAALGVANIPIQAGQFVAFFVVRKADSIGRRPILLWSLLGYAVFTTLTAASFNLWSFAAFQFMAQAFIGAEFGVAVTLLAEEYPPERRGKAMSKLLLFSPVGAILAGLLLAVGLLHTPLNWRAFFLLSFLPLMIVVIARRHLKESRMFELGLHEGAKRLNQRAANGLGGRLRQATAFLSIWTTKVKGRLLAVSLIALFQGLPSAAAIGWWTYYAERQRHLADGTAGTYFAAAAAFSILGYLACGYLMDKFGRKPIAIGYTTGAVLFGVAAFQVTNHLAMLGCLLFTAFFGIGIAPVLSAFAVELFPTDLRAQASAWIRNGFGNLGSLSGPALVGILGSAGGLIGNVADAASVLTLVAVPIIFIVWRFIPETKDEHLESTG